MTLASFCDTMSRNTPAPFPMSSTISTFDRLTQLEEELARERQLRIAAEAAARAQTWHALEGIARTLPLLVAWADRDCRFHFANERYA
ncbi:MAG: hypothetical protein M3Q69_13485, partial [Acidobacteriota bacterium]|nr:hypothetical protein [Acidobacteriota bacterium]